MICRLLSDTRLYASGVPRRQLIVKDDIEQ
jgi:hypothetical protein